MTFALFAHFDKKEFTKTRVRLDHHQLQFELVDRVITAKLDRAGYVIRDATFDERSLTFTPKPGKKMRIFYCHLKQVDPVPFDGVYEISKLQLIGDRKPVFTRHDSASSVDIHVYKITHLVFNGLKKIELEEFVKLEQRRGRMPYM